MKKSVLFVDDEEKILKAIKRMLFPYNNEWDMFFAVSGADGLQVLAKERIDVVVSDMRMPGMDGSEFLDEVSSRYPDVIRIILSGHSEKEYLMKSAKIAHRYLSKPCEPEVLKKNIDDSFKNHRVLENEKVKKIVTGMKSVPTIPEVYTKIENEMRKDDFSLKAIGEIIEQDPGMSAGVLKLVNSSFFGVANNISSPKQAVNLLGIEIIKGLILSAYFYDNKELNKMDGFSLQGLLNHSLNCARLSSEIGKTFVKDKEFADQCYSAGILHDLGKIVLYQNFFSTYKVVVEEAKRSNRCITKVEKEVIGVTHGEVGGYLLGLWNIDYSIIESVTLHHEPNLTENNNFSVLTAVHLANAMEHEIFKINDGYEERLIDAEYAERIGISDKIDNLTDLIISKFKEDK